MHASMQAVMRAPAVVSLDACAPTRTRAAAALTAPPPDSPPRTRACRVSPCCHARAGQLAPLLDYIAALRATPGSGGAETAAAIEAVCAIVGAVGERYRSQQDLLSLVLLYESAQVCVRLACFWCRWPRRGGAQRLHCASLHCCVYLSCCCCCAHARCNPSNAQCCCGWKGIAPLRPLHCAPLCPLTQPQAELDVPQLLGLQNTAMARLQRQAADAFSVLDTAQANLVRAATLPVHACAASSHVVAVRCWLCIAAAH